MHTILSKLSQNWKSGLTVSLVSIPLSVSLAVASQTSPVAGIITAVWAGLIAALFGGSNYNIIGPTGALSGILAAYAITHGAGSLSMLAIIAGVFILVAFAFKLQRFLVFVPASTVHGFTLGVAFIISLNQLNFALGLRGLEKHEHFIDNVIESVMHIQDTSILAVTIFAFFLIGLFVLMKLTPRIPGAILLAPLGILLGYLTSSGLVPFNITTLGSMYPDLTGRIFQMPSFFFDYSLLITGFTVAVVAILETMISAKIADGMTKTKHNGPKEMLGLGLANIASGLAGGIPATAALARTSLNVKSGATDKMSQGISSVAVALISLILLTYFSYIPLAVIAAILVFVAVRMVEMHHIKAMWKHDKINFSLAMFVAFITVYEDPIIGILLGTAVSLIIFMEKLSRGHFDLAMNDIESGRTKVVSGEHHDIASKHSDVLVYSIKGPLVYVNAQAHITRFERSIKKYRAVVIRLRECYFIDSDGCNALDEIIDVIKQQDKDVALSGINKSISEELKRECEGYNKLKKEHLIFEKTVQALEHFGFSKEA